MGDDPTPTFEDLEIPQILVGIVMKVSNDVMHSSLASKAGYLDLETWRTQLEHLIDDMANKMNVSQEEIKTLSDTQESLKQRIESNTSTMSSAVKCVRWEP